MKNLRCRPSFQFLGLRHKCHLCENTAKSIFISWDVLPTNHTYEEIFSLRVTVPSLPPSPPPPIRTVRNFRTQRWILCHRRKSISTSRRKINSVSSVHFNFTGLVVEKSSKSKFWPTTSVGMVRQVRSSLRKKISKVSNILNRFFRSFSNDFWTRKIVFASL